jgi:RHS repeat-associated protein
VIAAAVSRPDHTHVVSIVRVCPQALEKKTQMKSSKLGLVVEGGKGSLALGRGIAQGMGLAILFLASISAGAQALPDVEQGLHPYGSYHGGAIDQVSLTNGNLTLQAGLLAYSQRGELGYPITLRYNGKNFSLYQEPCPPGTQLPTTCPLRQHLLFGPNPLRTTNKSFGNSAMVGFDGFPASGGSRIDSSVAFDGNEIFVNPSSAILADGSTHQLVNTGSGYAAIDGSGFFSAAGIGAVADRNGTLSSQGLYAQDRHGNLINLTSDGTASVDTLGRQIPLAPGPLPSTPTPAASTASLSACPALNYAFQPVTYAYTWNLPTVNSGTLPLVLCYTGVWVRTGTATGPTYFDVNQTFNMLQSVVFPDQTFWAFQYDAADPNNTSTLAFGDLLKVTFPTGGSISYTWARSNLGCGSGVDRAVQTRTVNANDGTTPQPWKYVGNNGLMVVTDPMGNETVHTITPLAQAMLGGQSCSLYETQTQYYQGSHTGGTLLKTVNTDYQYTINPYDGGVIGSNGGQSNAQTVTNVFPIRVTTTLANGLVSKVETDYDAALNYHGAVDGITYNVNLCPSSGGGGAGNTKTNPPSGNPPTGVPCWGDQQTNGVTNYTGSYGKVVAKREYDWGQGAPGALLRQTKTTYQWQVNSAYLSANFLDLPASVQVLDGNGNQVALTTYGYDESSLAPSNVTTQFGAAPASVRGNLTSTHHWLNTSNSFITATTAYFDSGEVQSTTDPLNHSTTHTYSLTYAGAFATQTCNALNQCVSGVYDFNTGLITSFTDANQQTSNFSYDPRWRLTQALGPTDPVTGLRPETDFDDSVVNQVKRTKRQTASTFIVDYAIFDGVGRNKQTRLVDPQGDDFVDTTYDPVGRVSTVSNPHRAANSSTDGATTTFYDPLGRVTQVTKQDGSISAVAYDIVRPGTLANCTQTTDEASKQRLACSDALGRLVRVFEDPNGLNYETDYQYDTLGNLLRVDQKGSALSNSAQWRTRTFTYDSFSRLFSAYNPESGTRSYTYDAASNMVTKTAPAPNQTGSSTVTTTYSYDALNRVTQKSYSDSTPTAYFAYDGTSGNSVGRLREAWTGTPGCVGNAASGFGYDALGRVNSAPQATPVSTSLNSNWTTVDGQFILCIGAVALGVGADGRSAAYYNGTFGNDQYAQLTITAIPHGNVAIGPAVRVGPSGINYYAFYVDNTLANGGTGKYYLFKVVNGGVSVLASGPQSANVGDVVRLEVAGTTLTGKVNGVVLATTSDSSFPSGNPGIQTALFNNPNAATANNWSGGSISPAVSASDTFSGTSHGWFSVNYTYDLAGDMTSYTSGAGVTFSQSFDTTGRITQLTSNLSDSQHPATLATVDTSIGYYPPGEMRKSTFGNGVTETAAYNNRLQPCRMNVNTSGSALGTCNDAVIPGLGDFTYTYNAGSTDNGNVVSFSATGTQNFNRTYGYDSLNRLQSMSAPGDSCTGLSWTHDAWANRTDQTVTGGSCNTFHQTVNGQNWLSAAPYQYDAAGNMMTDGNHSYAYDAENRLILVDGGATASYSYDALGKRVRKSAGGMWTDYLYDLSDAVVTEYTSAQGSCVPVCWQATYISMGGKLAAEYKDGTTYFINKDHLGSTRFLTKPDQSLRDSMDYLPYGEQIAGATGSTHKFTGKERDGETGLDYFGARYYSNGLGRFVTPDWAAKATAVPYAEFADPQSLNLYSYVRNLPTTRFDADGHCGTSDLISAGGSACPLSQFLHNTLQEAAGYGKGLLSVGYHALMSSTPVTMAIDHFKGEPKSLQPSNDLQKIGKLKGAISGTAATLLLPTPKGAGARELLLDTSVVISNGRQFVGAANVVKAAATDVELTDLVAAGRINMPKAAAQIPTVPNSTNADLIDSVASGLTPKLRGNAADAVIGATAIERNATLVSHDKSLIDAVIDAGGMARKP